MSVHNQSSFLTFGGVGGSSEGGEGADVGEGTLAGLVGGADSEMKVGSFRQFADFVCVGVPRVNANQVSANEMKRNRQFISGRRRRQFISYLSFFISISQINAFTVFAVSIAPL